MRLKSNALLPFNLTLMAIVYGVKPNQQIHAAYDWASSQILLSMHPGCHQIQSPRSWCLNKSATSVIFNESVSNESIPSLAVWTHACVDKKLCLMVHLQIIKCWIFLRQQFGNLHHPKKCVWLLRIKKEIWGVQDTAGYKITRNTAVTHSVLQNQISNFVGSNVQSNNP